MSLKTNSVISVPELEFKSLLTPHRLRGMWRMMRGFRLKYLGANLSLGLAALFKHPLFYWFAILQTMCWVVQRRMLCCPYLASDLSCWPRSRESALLLGDAWPLILPKESPSAYAITSLTISSA